MSQGSEPEGLVGHLGARRARWSNRTAVPSASKLFTFWRRQYELQRPFSHLLRGQASISPFTQSGYRIRDKDLKKLHKATSVGDLGKAVQCEKELCATILLNHGADPNLKDLDGNTALHFAACGQSVSLVEKLLEHKANLEAQNKDGCTPLLLAVTKSNTEMVEFLLKRGADVNASDKNQRTALMIAISDEPTNLVSLLLQQDVDLSCQDIYGFTAEEYASFNGFTMYYQLIAKYGKKKAQQIPDSKDSTLGPIYDTEESNENV
ncbi:ankyrin repeat domain-containing protein 7 isoform X2 [Erinaceus europaeus]|uniref:Ankyrin repeat domain-containing protein 7 isoform X2 n=1 Tax=Erinaceus europaeus TaxID=9365 RepID=A0ABM3XS98_ERIEU|nr:ankyrin repeat domain-containing protein 7 isoform X2 [Erinaceus europaeus]